jgi:uncharacterized oxidoreductase
MLLHAETLERFAEAILKTSGSLDDEARTVARHLVAANLRGHDSHGIGMIPTYLHSLKAGALVPNRHATMVRDSGAIRVFDGAKGYGQIIATEAVEWAIGQAGANGVAIFALRNTHHVGRVGAYGEQAAKAGLISIFFVNVLTVSARTAPFGGREGRYGTDPICITFPATDSSPPVVLDFATSAVAAGKIRVAYNEGKTLPPGVYIDEDGRETRDPAIFIRDRKGAMLSFGGHKASGLALVCELLAGALTGSGAIQESALGSEGVRNGVLALVFDPAKFIDRAELNGEVDRLIAWVKSAPPLAGTDPVLVAGEPERLTLRQRSSDGIAIDERTWGELLQAAESAGVSQSQRDRILHAARGAAT